jgi:hypothetical protein
LSLLCKPSKLLISKQAAVHQQASGLLASLLRSMFYSKGEGTGGKESQGAVKRQRAMERRYHMMMQRFESYRARGTISTISVQRTSAYHYAKRCTMSKSNHILATTDFSLRDRPRPKQL